MKIVIQSYYNRATPDVYVGPFANEEAAQRYLDNKPAEDNYAGAIIAELRLAL